jgi:hypothetical protein
MTDTRAEKRAVVSGSPLYNLGVLETVLAYLDGLCLCVNAVCKAWKSRTPTLVV